MVPLGQGNGTTALLDIRPAGMGEVVFTVHFTSALKANVTLFISQTPF